MGDLFEIMDRKKIWDDTDEAKSLSREISDKLEAFLPESYTMEQLLVNVTVEPINVVFPWYDVPLFFPD